MSCCANNDGSGLRDTLRALPDFGWYYGNITVSEAERILQDEPNGAFLLRDTTESPRPGDLFTITFKARGRCGSVRVDYSKGYFTLSLADPGLPLFRTMMDLIGYCHYRSTVQKKPVCVLTGQHQSRNIYLYLTKPVSRHCRVHSLQHYCRQTIHSNVTLDKIQELPLPSYLLDGYMSQNPLYDAKLYPLDEDDCQSQVSASTVSTDLDLETDR